MEAYQRQDRGAMTCPWCGGGKIFHNTHTVSSAPYFMVDIGSGKILAQAVTNYSTCDCGLTFQENRQSDEWYNWFYSSGTYRQTLGISQEEMDADEQRRADDLIKWLYHYRNLFGYHLDIGASQGFFLWETCNQWDCLISGNEINKTHGNYGAFEYDKVVGYPDLVSAIHVLEHVTDPIKELTTWAQMTSKYLLIEVPGLHTVGGALRFAHLYYFPPELLKAKIIELGFDIVAMETEPNTRILAVKK